MEYYDESIVLCDHITIILQILKSNYSILITMTYECNLR
jgi:hypothetical protein